MKLDRILLSAVVGMSLAQVAYAHSWVDCTKWIGGDGAKATRESRTPDKCEGHTRDYFGRGGGTEKPFPVNGPAHIPNFHLRGTPQEGDTRFWRTCPFPKNDAANYHGLTRMATYRRGERVTLAWPARNHGAGDKARFKCSFPWPQTNDAFLRIHAWCNRGDDPSWPEIDTEKYIIYDLNKNGDFFNLDCPSFCSDLEYAQCFGSFVVPDNLPTGTCTFMWQWGWQPLFSSNYISCWDARVVDRNGGGGGGGRTTDDNLLPARFARAEIFDVEFYKTNNPDVNKAFNGRNSDVRQHWLQFGLREGRRASAQFDVQWYGRHYADLNKAFGNDWVALASHYLDNGLREGRKGAA